MSQKTHKMGTLSGGQYDKQAHGGAGKGQKLLSGTAGSKAGMGATPNARGAIVRDGIEGHGSPKRGYQTDAHTGLHHGKQGEAVGHKNDLHQDFTAPLYSEGRPLSADGTGPTFTPRHDHPTRGSHATAHPMGMSTKAEHHPPAPKSAHNFNYMSSSAGHGYGHTPSQCCGPLRMSGHSKGHQIGKK